MPRHVDHISNGTDGNVNVNEVRRFRLDEVSLRCHGDHDDLDASLDANLSWGVAG